MATTEYQLQDLFAMAGLPLPTYEALEYVEPIGWVSIDHFYDPIQEGWVELPDALQFTDPTINIATLPCSQVLSDVLPLPVQRFLSEHREQLEEGGVIPPTE